MKQCIIITISSIFLLAGYTSISLITSYRSLKTYQEDLAEINKINYGLFNLRIWKSEALKVFEHRIGEFEISPKAYDQVVIELDKYLRGINKQYIESGKIFENIFNDAEKNPNVNKVLLKMIKENTAPQIKFLNIPQYIPSMAVQLADELKKQEPQLKDIMRAELKKIIKDDDESTFVDPRAGVFSKYSTTDITTTNTKLKDLIDDKQIEIDQMIIWIYSLLMGAFIMSWVLMGYIGTVPSLTLITTNSIIMLVLGVNLPMIDIEALLNSFTINVLGTNIGFEKQYMYFQSKSILDVTETLIQGRGIDLKIVGWMVLCFSVVFPLIKLILSVLYLYSAKIRANKTIQNIIFYLGKWSMADVFVVALFMAYIGFYGIISSQLSSIANNEGGFAVETINNSKLSPGALFFTTYCIMSIIIGILVNKRVSNE
ncbi:MAG: paraquat-inducible protein A [Saprospiraceae bacterium]